MRSNHTLGAIAGLALVACSGPVGGGPTSGEVSTSPVGIEVPALHPDVDDLAETVVTIDTGTDAVEVAAKVAASPAERRRGLMHVPTVPDGVGMLFVFGEERTGGFWMKDTLVPLDIAFADATGRVVAVLAMEPCGEDPCEVYEPGASYVTALEVRQGWFAEAGVEEGDLLRWSPPLQPHA